MSPERLQMIDPVEPTALDPSTEIAAAQQLVLGALRQPVQINTDDGRTFIVVPGPQGSYKLENVTLPNKQDLALPKLANQHVVIQSAVSMAAYLNRFKNANTMLFADIDNNTIRGVIDYHEASVGNDDIKARLSLHTATLKLPFSQEWKIWSENSGKLMPHVDFATFLEENSFDIVEPAGADLLERCRDLQVKSNVDFSSSVRMGDTVSFDYQKGDDVTTKDKIGFPVQIRISIPVYFGERPVSVTCFLRRKVQEGRLWLGYVMSRAENVRQEEFHRVAGSIVDATGSVDTVGEVVSDPLTMVYGRPSA